MKDKKKKNRKKKKKKKKKKQKKTSTHERYRGRLRRARRAVFGDDAWAHSALRRFATASAHPRRILLQWLC